MRAAGSGYVLRIWGGFSRRVVGNPDSIGVGAYSVSKVAVRKFTQFVAEDDEVARRAQVHPSARSPLDLLSFVKYSALCQDPSAG